MTARRRTLSSLGALAALVVLGGCAKNAPQDTWSPAGENAQRIDNLQRPVFAVAGIVLVIVSIAVAYCVVRFRDKGQPMPEQTHGKPALEIALTILPALILIGVGGIFSAEDYKSKRENGADLVQLYTGWIYGGPGLVPRLLA